MCLGRNEARVAPAADITNDGHVGAEPLFDGGKLVKQFGDPRLVGATLPLFAVIGPDGKILHHHVGFYEVDRQQGLKELDQVIGQALKNKKKS